jgi:hypothetical protein
MILAQALSFVHWKILVQVTAPFTGRGGHLQTDTSELPLDGLTGDHPFHMQSLAHENQVAVYFKVAVSLTVMIPFSWTVPHQIQM